MLRKALLIMVLLMSGVVMRPLRAHDYLFSHLNRGNSGLSYDSVREIYQDSRGYMWIGTYKGLSRYDGTRFKNYSRDELGGASDFINVICEDDSGNLWIGTDNGVVIYDYKEDVFISLEDFVGEGQNVPNDRIFAIARNTKGLIWISSKDTGLYSFDPISRELTHHPMSTSERALTNNIYRLALDRNDNLYLAVYCDNIYLAGSDASACRPIDIGDWSDIFKGDDVEGLAVNPKSNDVLYVASKRNGIVEVDMRNHKCTSLCSLNPDVRPTNLLLDMNRYLWVSTTNGLICCNLHSGSCRNYSTDLHDPFSLSDSYITDVYRDKKGGLWVGSQYGGLNHYSPYHDNFRKVYSLDDGNTLDGAIVRDFAEDKWGNIWVATERMGLLRYTGEKLASAGRDLPKSVLAVADDMDCLWIGSQKGISRLDYDTFKVTDYRPFTDDDRDNRVITIYRSQSGTIFVATTMGVLRYERNTDRFELLENLGNITFEYMTEDSAGVLWLASYSSGVFSYDAVNDVVLSHYSPQTGSRSIPDMVSSVSVDNVGNIWVIGFSNGFFKYDKKKDDFISFSSHTLPSLPTDVFFRALPDDFGHLWISSDKGIVDFNMSENTVRVFTEANGLMDDEFTKAAIVLRNGSIAMGSANGFVIFNPRSMQVGDAISNVRISDMYLKHEPVSAEARALISGGNVDLKDNITLEYSDNSFGFSFALLDSESPSSDNLFCMLEGYDGDWRDISVDKAMHWNNVLPGTYTLLLSNGEYNGNFVHAHSPLTIVVKPKFWASTLGIILIVCMAGGFMLLVMRLIIRRHKQKSKHKLDEYRARKEQELMKDKMTFFSNIIHEIKTPLTLIRTPLQRLISSGGCDKDVLEELTVIASSTDYMNDLVRELLEFVRLEEHGYVLDLKNVDIVERVGFLCYNFSETARNKNIKIQYTHDLGNLEIAVDTIAFRKIINNLMDNGVKYADTYIQVDLSVKDEMVVVTFRNDGTLIPASRRELIFKPFVQYSDDESPYSQSFGIGLAYARHLTELHDGTLTLSDNPDCTEFVLSLPVKTVPKMVAEEEDMDEVKRSDLPLVMIIEDNVSLANYLKKNLKHQYNVVSAQSAEKGLALLATYKADIILTDIALHGMSGVELCHKVNSDPELSHIPVIVVSAISSVETKMKCMEYGACNYIEKPYSMDYLLACIKGALEKRAALRAVYGSTPGTLENIHANLINRDEDFLRKLEKVVLENMCNPSFSNKQLEEMLFMGHSTLNRKMKALLNTTPNEYIRSKRLALAAEMLMEGGSRINEICYAVGFNSPSYFAKCFKSAYGKLPVEWARERHEEKDE